MSDPIDVLPMIAAKSAQLNADDLVSGPLTVQITGARRGNREQPLVLDISGGHQPWKPCKTTMRIMAFAWGTDAEQWVGHWARLVRDPSVRYGGVAVGGIRIEALSHIERPISISLAVSRGKKRLTKIGVLQPAEQQQQGAPTADLDAYLTDEGLTVEDLDRWRAQLRPAKGPTAELSQQQRAQLAGWLASAPDRLDAIRALIPDTNTEQK